MKNFFKNAWKWIKANKVVSIVVASVLAVGITCAIVLPIALKHEHTFFEDWKTDEKKHWHAPSCEHTDLKSDEGEHTFENENCDAKCTVCGYQKKGTHEYDNNCDDTCNVEKCTYKRTAPHDYAGGCDTKCDSCDEVRETSTAHKYLTDCATKCDTCGDGAREAKKEHTYSNSCDTNCNACKEQRTAEHEYDNTCDNECNVCGAPNANFKAHEYDNTCDNTCNVCGAPNANLKEHEYDNTCDNECNVCGAPNANFKAHEYDNTCDNECNVCGAPNVNFKAHEYDNTCDNECNVCGAPNANFKAHEYDNTCDNECNVCGAPNANFKAHEYDNTCDNECNVCGAPNVNFKAHEYDNTCDNTCNVCGAPNANFKAHEYDDCDDTDCNVCGNTREADTHDYVATGNYVDVAYIEEKCSKCEKIIAEDVRDGYVVARTQAEAQAALDGDINGKTLVLLGDADFGVLYVRIREDVDESFDDGIWAGSGNYTYNREFNGVTIMGASETEKASVEAIVFEAAQYTLDGNIHSNSATSPYLNAYIEINNFMVQYLSFTGEQTAIDLCNRISAVGLTIDSCDMTGSAENVKLLHRSGAQSEVKDATGAYIMTVGLMKDITINNCVVDNVYQVVELRGTENVTITNNKFTNISDRVILLTIDGVAYTGTITITGNEATNIGERFVRFNGQGYTEVEGENVYATIVVSNNTIVGYTGTDKTVIKITATDKPENVTCENNTLASSANDEAKTLQVIKADDDDKADAIMTEIYVFVQDASNIL